MIAKRYIPALLGFLCGMAIGVIVPGPNLIVEVAIGLVWVVVLWGILGYIHKREEERREQPTQPPVKPLERPDLAPYKLPTRPWPLTNASRSACCPCSPSRYEVGEAGCGCECHYPTLGNLLKPIDLGAAQKANRAIIDGANAHYKKG